MANKVLQRQSQSPGGKNCSSGSGGDKTILGRAWKHSGRWGRLSQDK